MSTLSLIASSLKKGQKNTFISKGNSMSPLIPNNTKITIIPKKFSEIRLYDIVAIKIKNNIVIHQCLFKCPKYLVCQGVNNHFIDLPALPNQILGTVEIDNYYQIINLAYDYELRRIHNLIPKIPILILKGATWQKFYYGYYFNKQSSDIDILIHKSDFSQLKKTLTKLHYSSSSINQPQSEISFYKNISSQKFCIDIHFQAIRCALNPIFREPINPMKMNQLTIEFWESSSLTNNLYFLKNEYLLFYFCLNSIFHHGVRGTDLLATIASIISKEKINWLKFWLLVDKYNMNNFVYYPLGWSSRLYKIKILNLNQHRPNIFRRSLSKIFINHYTVFRPFMNLGKNFLSSKINTSIISLLRIFLYSSPNNK